MTRSKRPYSGADVTLHVTTDQPAKSTATPRATQTLKKTGICPMKPDGLLVGIRLLPEIFAAPVEGRRHLDGAVTLDAGLAGQAHFVLMADTGEGQRQAESLAARLGGEVFHALLDEDAAGATQAQAAAVEVTIHPRVDRD